MMRSPLELLPVLHIANEGNRGNEDGGTVGLVTGGWELGR